MQNIYKEEIASLVKEGRTARHLTQLELAEKTGISLRSIQRIENAEVFPRMYTIKLLSQHLGFSWEPPASPEELCDTTAVSQSTISDTATLNKAQKMILTLNCGILLILLSVAFVIQSPRFPETTFELILLVAGVTGFYTIILLRIWK